MAISAGPGPYRAIPDHELRQVFYLQPQTAWLFEFIPITTSPPPGTNDPRITLLLRRMLYLRTMNMESIERLATEIHSLQSDRQMIAISAKLLSFMRHVFSEPWAFPALLKNEEIIYYRRAFSGVVDVTRIPGNVTASTPAAVAIGWLSKFAGTAVAHTSYAASLTNRHYDFYLQRMNTELNLRGINASLLP